MDSWQRRHLLAEIEAMPITVERLPFAELLAVSLVCQYDFQRTRVDFDVVGGGAFAEVRHRWALKYIRYHLTEYDHTLAEKAGRPGMEEAAALFKSRVNSAIACAYPELMAYAFRPRRSA
jgi:hypothetical protein